jgi:hypothetical protein
LLPVDEGEVAAAVVGVAALALVARVGRHAPVQPRVVVDARAQLGVAGEAARGRLVALLIVAVAALVQPLQRGVRFGQGPGREELRARWRRQRRRADQGAERERGARVQRPPLKTRSI